MIISRTPHRISLFGGGTDFPEHFLDHEGAVLGFSIDRFIYHTLSTLSEGLFDYKLRLAYSITETVIDVEEVRHGPFREIIKQTAPELGYEIHVCSDLPAFSGLGSSSSFSVGLLNLFNEYCDMHRDKYAIAREAIRIERDVLLEKVGWQDQIFASHGGFNIIQFRRDATYEVIPLELSEQKLEELVACSLLVHTGIRRRAQDIEKVKFQDMSAVKGKLLEIQNFVGKAEQILCGNKSIAELGQLLNRLWNVKRSLSGAVSNDAIDSLYSAAIKAGAWGGKLLGAGGGGCLFFLVPPERRSEVIGSLNGVTPIEFTVNRTGAEIMFSTLGGAGANQ